MQTNSLTHPYRVLWTPKRGGYHATARHKSFFSEQEARNAANQMPGYRVWVQRFNGRGYEDLK
jgi:hypothetical protein